MTPSQICSFVSSAAVIFSFSAACNKTETDYVTIVVSTRFMALSLTFSNKPLEKLLQSSTRWQHMLQDCHREMERPCQNNRTIKEGLSKDAPIMKVTRNNVLLLLGHKSI